MVAFSSADPLLREAVELERSGDTAGALARYRAFLGQNPGSRDAPAVRRRIAALK